MGGFDGVSVEVISEGRSLPLYDDPDEEPDQHSRIRQRYVEAVTGAAFKVKISLTRDFRLYGLEDQDAVQFSIDFDGKSAWQYDMAAQDLRQIFRVDGIAEYRLSTI